MRQLAYLVLVVTLVASTASCSSAHAPEDASTSDAATTPDAAPDAAPDVGRDAWIDPLDVGQIATSCGAESQGLVPVDCTSHGDVDAYCVFGNHCACTTGFVCERPGAIVAAECEPGAVCVPP